MNIKDVKLPLVEREFSAENFKVISGGQTGADQAGLLAARNVGFPSGGWAPKGWKTQDGPKQKALSDLGLVECEVEGYPPRTERNVRDADVTLRFASDMNSAGERCTLKAINKHKKPYVDFHVPDDLTPENAAKLGELIKKMGWTTINVAGNSERTSPGIGEFVFLFLSLCFTYLTEHEDHLKV